MKLPRVHRVMRSGKMHKYHRVTRVPLPNDVPEDHDLFIAAWTAAEQAKAPAKRAAPGTVGAVCDDFMASRYFGTLSKDYGRTIARNVEAIRVAYGEAKWRAVKGEHIEADLAKMEPIAARARRKAWRLLAKQAKGEDPSATVKAPVAPRTDGHKPWSAAEIAAFRAKWQIGSAERAAFELLLWTAARTIDAVTLSPAMVGSDGVLTYRQGKTSNPAHVPWTCQLPAWARGWESERDLLHRAIAPSETYLETTYGKARTPKGLSNLISTAAKKAGVQKSAHGLRKSRLTFIAEAGGSTGAIMSWGGHVTMAEAQRYTDKAERKRLLIGENAT